LRPGCPGHGGPHGAQRLRRPGPGAVPRLRRAGPPRRSRRGRGGRAAAPAGPGGNAGCLSGPSVEPGSAAEIEAVVRRYLGRVARRYVPAAVLLGVLLLIVVLVP